MATRAIGGAGGSVHTPRLRFGVPLPQIRDLVGSGHC